MRTAAGFVLATAMMMATAGSHAGESEYEMTTFQFALLKDGPRRDAIQGEQAEAQQVAHLAFLESLVTAGQVLAVGPVEDAAPVRGVVVLTVGSVEKAREILAGDPWIRAGHLAAEIHTWWAAKDILQPAFSTTSLAPCWLGLLKRPADAPEFSAEKLKVLQEGHMANIKAMAASGDLVIAGPMGEDGVLRGIFLFRTGDEEEVRALVNRDPSIQANRLEMELVRWYLPEGTLPPQ